MLRDYREAKNITLNVSQGNNDNRKTGIDFMH